MRRIDIVASLWVTSMWGLAFVAVKKVLESGPPLTLAGVRFMIAGALLLPLAARRPRQGAARSPTVRELLVVGLLHTTLLYGLGNLGIERATAGASALLLNTNPVIVAFLAVPLLGEALRPRAVLGGAVALAGVGVISVRSGLGSPSGIALLLTGAVAWAAASISVKRLGSVDLIRLSCGQMFVGGVPLLVLGIVGEHTMPRPNLDADLWFAFLVVVATAINVVIWFGLLERYSASAMTSWLFLSPVFGVLAGALILDERVGWRLLVGGPLVLLGVLLSQEYVRHQEVVLDAGG